MAARAGGRRAEAGTAHPFSPSPLKCYMEPVKNEMATWRVSSPSESRSISTARRSSKAGWPREARRRKNPSLMTGGTGLASFRATSRETRLLLERRVGKQGAGKTAAEVQHGGSRASAALGDGWGRKADLGDRDKPERKQAERGRERRQQGLWIWSEISKGFFL
jgi:hypothetical protein